MLSFRMHGASIVGFFMATIAVVLSMPPTAQAVVPPDSCFSFSAGIINSYYNNEGSNPANPACPKNVDIPATIGGVGVTTIGGYAFDDKQLTAATIPSSVTIMGVAAFANNQLTSVTIPSSVTVIGAIAFNNNLLTTLPSYFSDPAITTLPYGIFGNNKFTSLTIPNNITNIGEDAFISNQLTTVTIPSSVTSIGIAAFSHNHLTSLVLPNSVTDIGASAFFNNQLSSLTLSASLTAIDDWVFGVNRLASVTVPDSVTAISNTAFAEQSLVTYTEDARYYPERAAEQKAWYDSLFYTRIYTSSPNNPNHLTDVVYLTIESEGGDTGYIDYNGNGTIEHSVVAGGHLINPVSVTMNFVDGSGAQLEPSLYETGRLADATVLSNYIVIDGPIVPGPADLLNPSPAETQAIQDALKAYHRIGNTYTYTASVINGMIPTPASYNFVLGTGTDANTKNFVYAAAPASSDQKSGSSQLSNTGMSLVTVAVAGLAAILLGLGLVWRHKKSSWPASVNF